MQPAPLERLPLPSCPHAHHHIREREREGEGGRDNVSESQISGGERDLNRKTAPVKTRKTLNQGGNSP